MECEFSSFEYEDASVTNLAPVALVHLRIRSRTSVRAVVCSVAELVCVGIDRQLEFDPGSTFADAAVAVLHSIVVASGVVCWMPSLPSCASFPTATGAPLRMQRMRRRLMDPAPRGRAYRVKVTVIEEPAQPEAFRVSVTLRGAWGFRVYRGGFVIGPAGLIVRPRVAGETDRNEPASAKDRRQTRACHEDGPGNLAAPAGRPRGHSRISASADAMCFPHSTHRPDTSACG